MRSLNAHNTYISDWDPNKKLLYIVRDDYLINANIDCFELMTPHGNNLHYGNDSIDLNG